MNNSISAAKIQLFEHNRMFYGKEKVFRSFCPPVAIEGTGSKRSLGVPSEFTALFSK